MASAVQEVVGFMRLTENFTDNELSCPCCGKADMDSDFMLMLQFARDFAGVPFHVTSGFRCVDHNAEIGGVLGSSHTKGVAVDIRANTSRERFVIIDALIHAGFTRIGIGNGFVHADTDKTKSQNVIWGY